MPFILQTSQPPSWIMHREHYQQRSQHWIEFVLDALPVELIGMNLPMMCDYIKFFADRLLVTLGCQRHYKTGNLFKWMEAISLQGKPISLRNVLESMLNRESVLKIWLKSSATMSVSKPQFIRPTYSTILFMNTLFPYPLSPRLYRKQKSTWKNQETLKVQWFFEQWDPFPLPKCTKP